jgi:hypothetical protein
MLSFGLQPAVTGGLVQGFTLAQPSYGRGSTVTQKSVNASRNETMRLPICGTLHSAL